MITTINKEMLGLIKQQVSMRDVARLVGLDVNSKGFCRCPFHNEKTASFKVYEGDRGFHCFGCDKSGDIFDFIQEYYGMKLPQSVAYIDTHFGLGLTQSQLLTREERRRIRRKQEAERERRQQEEKEKKALEVQYDSLCTINRELTALMDILMKGVLAKNKEETDMFDQAVKMHAYVEYTLDEVFDKLYIGKVWKRE